MSTPSITETVYLLKELDREFARLTKLHLSTMQHLLAEQADAVAPSAAQAGVAVTGGSYDNVAVMLASAGKLSGYGRKGRKLDDATKGIAKAYRDWQNAIDDALSEQRPDPDDRPRCPGTHEDADGRLGGCGNLTERYHEGGRVKYRPLCKKCRTQASHAT